MLAVAQEYILILANYENTKELQQRFNAGIDITDELYERLAIHDEMAAEAFIEGHHAPA